MSKFYYLEKISFGIHHYYQIEKSEYDSGETFLKSLHLNDKCDLINIAHIDITEKGKYNPIPETVFKEIYYKTVDNLGINNFKHKLI
jgi:hypothetical protein